MKAYELCANRSREKSVCDLPLVTVFIPTKNRRELLNRAIDSVLAQSYKNIELIVVDDASVDGTADYLREVSALDSRVTFISNSASLGACAARNAAIDKANGVFITGLDDDDFFLPERISGFVSSWVADPNLVGLYSDTVLEQVESRRVITRPRAVTQRDLLRWNAVGNQIFTATSKLKGIGGFDVDFPAWQDLSCWYRLLSPSGAYMARAGGGTYVCDASHSHERISTAGLVRQEKAYELFSRKFSLTKGQRALLRTQLLAYSQSTVAPQQALAVLFHAPGLHTLKFFVRTLLLSAKERLM